MKEKGRTLILTDIEFTILLDILHQLEQSIAGSQRKKKITFPFTFNLAVWNIFSTIVNKARTENIYRTSANDKKSREVKKCTRKK